MNSIFELTSRHARWNDQRRVLVAENIANADTPGYRARDLADFSTLLQAPSPALATTHSAHQSDHRVAAAWEAIDRPNASASHSGNTVDLAHELSVAGAIARAHALQTSVVRTFHKMHLAGTRA
jgi:flagellar basal-body rod protein FlgB